MRLDVRYRTTFTYDEMIRESHNELRACPTSDDRQQLDGLLSELRVGSEGGANIRPIRVFPIAYGKDADKSILRQIAEASNAAAYDASNPATIEQVFAAVISNF